MNGFLVLLRCMMDDLPLRLCETREEAVIQAGHVTAASPEIVEALQIVPTDPISVCVVQFAKGRPVSWETVRRLDHPALVKA